MIEIILITVWALITCILTYQCVRLLNKNHTLTNKFAGMEQSRDYWKNVYMECCDYELTELKKEHVQTKESEIQIVQYSSGKYSINRGDYVYSAQGEWVTLEEANRWNYNHCLYDSFDQVEAIAKAMKDNFVIINAFTVV